MSRVANCFNRVMSVTCSIPGGPGNRLKSMTITSTFVELFQVSENVLGGYLCVRKVAKSLNSGKEPLYARIGNGNHLSQQTTNNGWYNHAGSTY